MPKQKVLSRNSGIISNIAPYDISGPSSTKSNGNSSFEVPSTSHSSGLISEPSSNSISTATDLERKASELVQYFLIADQKKIPIRKLDINNHVLKEHKKHFPVVVAKAREMLLNVFGSELLELDDKMKGRYILVNKKHEGVLSNLDMMCREEEAIKLGLLFNILAIIYMNGDIISDTELWKTLRKLGIDSDCRHEIFGDIKKLVLDEFVKQAYLEYIKQTNSDPPSYQFHWGQRAKRELQKKDVLVYVSKIYGKEPTEWKSLWQDCIAEERGVGAMET